MSSNLRTIIREYVEAALWALLITLFLRAFVIQAFRIPSESMRETLLVGDFLFVNKFEYGAKIPFTDIRLPGFRKPQRGDVIVFQFPKDPSKDFIKRCVATGNQTLSVHDKQVSVNDTALVEPYTIFTDSTVRPASQADPDIFMERGSRDNCGPFAIPEGELFMMGDNRDNSNDSRYWGPMEMNLIKGRAVFIYWSWNPDKHWPRWDRLLNRIR